MIEIEKKAYLRDPRVLEKIKQISQYKGFFLKEDCYYGPENKAKVDFYQDRVFRLRRENNHTVLSFKKKSFLGKTEVNQEHEMDVSQVDATELAAFFDYLGYAPLIEKNKRSHVYRIENKKNYPVTIEHNLIDGLGEFIEIEILTAQESETAQADAIIGELFSELGIQEQDIEPRYYIELISGRQAQ